jgi:uncharacterized membrane protein YdfJ with MMPL/SSD domain
MSTLAGWCFRHRLAVIGFWALLVAFTGLFALSQLLLTVAQRRQNP